MTWQSRRVPEYKAETSCEYCIKIIPVGDMAVKIKTSGGIGDNWGWYCNQECLMDLNTITDHWGDMQSKKDRENPLGATDRICPPDHN